MFLFLLWTHEHKTDPIRGKEAIIDAYAQRITVDWFPEILIRLHSLSTQRRRRQPYLDSVLKMLQDDTPSGIGLSTTPVALIHDNDIKEVTGEVAIQARARLIIGHSLIGCEDDIPARCCFTQDTLACITKWREIIIHRLA